MTTIQIPFKYVKLGQSFIYNRSFYIRTKEEQELRAYKADGTYWYPSYDDVLVRVLA